MPKHCTIPTTELAMRAVLWVRTAPRGMTLGEYAVPIAEMFGLSRAQAYRVVGFAKRALGDDWPGDDRGGMHWREGITGPHRRNLWPSRNRKLSTGISDKKKGREALTRLSGPLASPAAAEQDAVVSG